MTSSDGADDERERPAQAAAPARPFPGSLCWRCARHRAIAGARSTFVMCDALPVKYPRQPVLACPAFSARPGP